MFLNFVRQSGASAPLGRFFATLRKNLSREITFKTPTADYLLELIANAAE
jgi:hypothetical protein